MMRHLVLLVVLCFSLSIPVAGAAEVVEYVLDNGLRVRLVPSAGEKDVLVLLGVRAGFMNEPAGVPHVAHVTEHLAVFDLPPAEAKAVAEWAKSNKVNGETLAELMYFDLHVPRDDVELALSVQAARLAGGHFSPDTLTREVPRTLAEIDFVEKSAFPAAGKFALAPFVQAALYVKIDQPIRARTGQITVEQVQAFHGRTFLPNRAAIVVIGDFDPAAVRKAIDLRFGDIKVPDAAPAPRPALKPGDLTADWDVATRHLFIAWPAPAAEHADHPALTLAAMRLMQSLAADASMRALGDATPMLNDIDGVFLISIQAKPDADLDDLKMKVLTKVAQLTEPEAWTDAELNRLRIGLAQLLMLDIDLATAQLPPGVTKMMAHANIEIQRMAKSLVWGDLDAYRRRLKAVEPEAVARAVAKHLNPASVSVVRVQSATIAE